MRKMSLVHAVGCFLSLTMAALSNASAEVPPVIAQATCPDDVRAGATVTLQGKFFVRLTNRSFYPATYTITKVIEGAGARDIAEDKIKLGPGESFNEYLPEMYIRATQYSAGQRVVIAKIVITSGLYQVGSDVNRCTFNVH